MFTIRVFHSNVIFMLGPEANHFMTVSHAANFSWRRGFMGDLIPLLGDGLLTIDGDFHRQSRRIMLPAFHRERIEAAHAIMTAETRQALDRVSADTPFDLYRFTRELALRIAMRALFGLDPDRARAGGINAAHEFEQALGFWARDYLHQILRGPGSPWRRMVACPQAAGRADLRRDRSPPRRARRAARTSSPCCWRPPTRTARRLSKRHIRDEVMTLMFAGHDTTTSTVAFLFHELARNPRLAEEPSFDLGLAIDETLRLYPPAWIGPRRSIAPFRLRRQGPARTACRSTTARGPATACPTCGPSPTPSVPSASPPATASGSPRAPTSPSAGARACASGCASGWPRWASSPPRSSSASASSSRPAIELQTRQMPTIGPKHGMPMVPRAAKGGPVVAEPALAA